MTETKKKLYRLTLDFTETSRDQLEGIKRMSGVDNNAGVIQSALRIFEWHLTRKKENKRFILEDSLTGEQTEVEFVLDQESPSDEKVMI